MKPDRLLHEATRVLEANGFHVTLHRSYREPERHVTKLQLGIEVTDEQLHRDEVPTAGIEDAPIIAESFGAPFPQREYIATVTRTKKRRGERKVAVGVDPATKTAKPGVFVKDGGGPWTSMGTVDAYLDDFLRGRFTP